MVDYFTPTVVTPPLPITLLTKVERFILTTLFDHDVLAGEGGELALFLHAALGVDEERRIDRAAFDAIADAGEPGTYRLVMLIDMQIRTKNQHDEPDPIVSFINGLDPSTILQGIVRRNPDRLPVLVIHQALTCSTLCADGVGGTATVITADAIDSLCTTSWAAARVAAIKRATVAQAGEVM